jgi:hypothetical protein
MSKRDNREIAAILAGAAVERERIAAYLDHQAEVHEELCGGKPDDWHMDMAKQLYEAAERVRGGLL